MATTATMKQQRRSPVALLAAAAVAAALSSSRSVCTAWTLLPSQQHRRATTARGATTAAKTAAGAIELNPLLRSIQPSMTVEIFSQVKELEAAGEIITSLCVGEPDFGPPASVLAAATAALAQGDVKYTAVTGTLALRTAICHDLARRKDGLTYRPNQIVVANGAKQAVYQALLTLVGVGDGVIIPAPYWPSYPEQVRLCGGVPVMIETTAENGYLLRPDDLRQCLEGATKNDDDTNNKVKIKAIILCHPSNPTGAVYSRDEILELGRVLRDYPHVTIVADEIYERLVYYNNDEEDEEGTECPAIAQVLPDLSVVTINGFSKAYAMTGFRLGYLATSNDQIASAAATLQGQLTSCASSVAQAAGVAALLDAVNDEWVADRVRELKSKRDYVIHRLRACPHVHMPAAPPGGAFYVLPDISTYCGFDDADFCVRLLKRHKLAIVPGTSFGAPGTVRLSYATSLDELTIAMDKLEAFLREERDRLGL